MQITLVLSGLEAVVERPLALLNSVVSMGRQTGYDYMHAAAVVANVRARVHTEPTLTQAVLLHALEAALEA